MTIKLSDPNWLNTARQYIGTTEIKGPKHNSIIVNWRKKLKSWMLDDDNPWCGDFVAHCLQENGLPYPKNYFRALEWKDYGALLRNDRLAPGAILVFQRPGGGHVGFYVGEDATHYHVLGGNQSNQVNIMRLEKNRLVTARWPDGRAVNGGPVRLSSSGVPLSSNEA